MTSSRRFLNWAGNLPVLGPVFVFVADGFGIVLALLKRERIGD